MVALGREDVDVGGGDVGADGGGRALERGDEGVVLGTRGACEMGLLVRWTEAKEEVQD